MGYHVYLAGVLLPVTPASIQTSVKNRNQTFDLINEGEANLLKLPGPMELSFDALLPQVRYPFASYEDYSGPAEFIRLLEKLKQEKQKFRFIAIRSSPRGEDLFDTNIRVSLEEYSIKEDAQNGLDLSVSIKLREYVDFGTRTVPAAVEAPAQEAPREQDNAPKKRSHTVVKGDCLWNIAQQYLGNGSRYPEIYQLNQSVIDGKNKGTGNPRNTIYPGQVLALPD